jgi:hypothetical protein
MNFLKIYLFILILSFASTKSILIHNNTQYDLNIEIRDINFKKLNQCLIASDSYLIPKLAKGSYRFFFSISKPSIMEVNKEMIEPQEVKEGEDIKILKEVVVCDEFKYYASYFLKDFNNESYTLTLEIKNQKLNEEAIAVFTQYNIEQPYKLLVVTKEVFK